MSTPFATALETGDLAALRRCAKADLHVHAIGGGSRGYLLEQTGRDVEPVTGVLASIADMHAWVEANLGALFEGASASELDGIRVDALNRP